MDTPKGLAIRKAADLGSMFDGPVLTASLENPTNLKVSKTMGMIADDLDRTLQPQLALTVPKVPLIVTGAGLLANGAPVMGASPLDTTVLNLQIDALGKTVTALAKAIRRLEDKR